jgi:hypothetical protein
MDEILATGQGRARFQICQVNNEESQTAQVFQAGVLITYLMQEAIEEVGVLSTKEMEKFETFQTGSERDPCHQLWLQLPR